MPSAAQKARAKLDAVLNDPGRTDSSGLSNRIAATRYPSGGSEYTNAVARRPSQSSQSSDGSNGGRFRKMMKDLMSRPAY
ncbi:hypothetical protein B0J13DRAFT_538809 [Dactylonectria estremocensis]|uniref:Uncharacterized protein n=1 Tax=Dactylonectria estremocensis TaxID=1079267 RepID=A0A9P9FKI7_9HYPO|nr:hypothetical protein B0J13DRAFT_538809 [Dactylonectria estremocensis]